MLISNVWPNISYFFGMIYSDTDIKYYYSLNGMDWTLGATHTTNIPESTNLFPGMWIKNNAAADKRLRVDGFKIMQGGVP